MPPRDATSRCRSADPATRRGTRAARSAIDAVGTPAFRRTPRSAAMTRWISASRAIVASHASATSGCSASNGPSTCSISTRPVRASAATSGGTIPGSTSASSPVTATSWAKTAGTCLAHRRPRSVSRVSSADLPQDRTWRTGPCRRIPASPRRSSIQATISGNQPGPYQGCRSPASGSSTPASIARPIGVGRRSRSVSATHRWPAGSRSFAATASYRRSVRARRVELTQPRGPQDDHVDPGLLVQLVHDGRDDLPGWGRVERRSRASPRPRGRGSGPSAGSRIAT